MLFGKSDCLEGTTHGITYARCHFEQGNQYFRFNLETLHIHWGRWQNNLCIDADADSSNVFINFCDNNKETQKWVWGFSRVSWLKDWPNHGAPILDEHELRPMSNTSKKPTVLTTPGSCRI